MIKGENLHRNSSSRHCLLLIFVLIFTGCSVPTKVRVHPEFVKHPEKTQSISILPVDCFVETMNLSDANGQDQEREHQIIEQISAVIPGLLTSQRYAVSTYEMPEDTLLAEALHSNYDALKKEYFRSIPIMYAEPKTSWEDIASYPTNISAENLSLLHESESDALLYIRYTGFKRSGGSMAAGVAGGVALGLLTGYAVVPLPENGVMQAALIDCETGNILWNNFSRTDNYSLENLLENLFESFPNYQESLTHYIENGKEIKHPFRVEDYGYQSILPPSTGEDLVTVDDGREFYGKVIDISKKNLMLQNRRTLYIISKKRIASMQITGVEISLAEASKTDYPRVNYNSFDARVEIY